jgi:hypothetical protein
MQSARGLHGGVFEFNVKAVNNRKPRRCKQMLKIATSKELHGGKSEHADELLGWLYSVLPPLLALAALRIAWIAATQEPGLWPVAFGLGVMTWLAFRARG